MMPEVRVRFAPSPTGFLHIGGARTALFNWLFARKHEGTFILRIEDTDELRSTAESVGAILDSLRWLGLDWDEGPLVGPEARAVGTGPVAGPEAAGAGPKARWPGSAAAGAGQGGEDVRERGDFGPYTQMARLELYRGLAMRLLEEGKAYRCVCTPEETEALRRAHAAGEAPGRRDCPCRDMSPAAAADAEAAGRKASIRFRMPADGFTEVQDAIRGLVRFENRLLQDLVILKRGGGPTYNFACVVDDHLMGITHVIRGDEHLPNTPSQIRIYRALGWEPPPFAHLSMILGPDGTKLSKRHGATSVLEYKSQGYLPVTMVNYLALLGWSTPDSRQLFTKDELAAAFGLEGCQKNPAVFDPQKLLWMNGVRLRELAPEALAEAAAPFLEAAGLAGAPAGRLLPALRLEADKFKLLPDVPRRVEIFFKPVVFEERAVAKVLKAQGAGKVLEDVAACLRAVEPFTEAALEAAVRGFCESRGLKPGAVFHPLRVAVSGRTEGPTLFGMLELLGKDAVLERVAKARRLAS